jgi:hypothetical protein
MGESCRPAEWSCVAVMAMLAARLHDELAEPIAYRAKSSRK